MNVHRFLEWLSEREGQINVDANLSVRIDRAQFALTGDGQELILRPQSRSDLWQLVRYRASGVTDHLQEVLNASGLTVEVSLHGRTLGRVGKRAEPGIASMLSGFGKVQLCPGNLFIEALSALNPFSSRSE